MSDNTAGQAEHSLWTDEQHDAYALGMQTEREHQEALAKLAARKHEEHLAAAQERIAQLEANADPEALVIAYGKGYSDAQDKARARIKELEAQLKQYLGNTLQE